MPTHPSAAPCARIGGKEGGRRRSVEERGGNEGKNGRVRRREEGGRGTDRDDEVRFGAFARARAIADREKIKSTILLLLQTASGPPSAALTEL